MYRKLKNDASKPLPSKSSKSSKPQYKLLGKGGGGGDGLGTWHIYGPPWVKAYVSNVLKHSSGSDADGVYYLKGKRYRYKAIIEYLGDGGWRVDTYRRPRTWYWKKLNS